MAISIPKYQALYFQSLQGRTINNGNSLITNGNFDTNLSGWVADDYTWSAGTASYNWTYGLYNGSIKQEYIQFLAGKRYKIQFKYRATNDFEIVVRLRYQAINTSLDLLTEATFNAIPDGNWHIVEYYVNSIVNSTQFLVLGSRGSTVDGLQFDDVSIYEQELVSDCKPCDTVVIDKNKPLEFQVSGRHAQGNNLIADLNANPFSPITSTNLSFDLNFNGSGEIDFNTSFQLYIGNKTYIFIFANSVGASAYTLITDGNINYVRINSAVVVGVHISQASLAGRLYTALIDIIDANHGTTTTIAGSLPFTIIIANVPTGSYLLNNHNTLKNITTIGSGSITSIWNMYYDTDLKKLCYNNFGVQSDSLTVAKNVTLAAGVPYIIRIECTSDYDDWEFTNIFIDDYTNPILVVPVTITQNISGGYVEYEFTPTTSGTYGIGFELDDPNGYNSGFCISKFATNVYALDNITIQAKDCNGNITTLPFTQIPYGENVLIQINNNDFPENTFQVIITEKQNSATGLQHFSQSLELLDTNNMKPCNAVRLLKIQWSDTCKYNGIDYNNLPYTNELYIRGYIKKLNSDKKERIMAVNTNGSYSTVYNHSIGKSEIRIGQYSFDIHNILSHAVEHSEFIVNDTKYYLDDASIYTTSDNNNGYYTARIELAESGTEVIKTSCCC